MTPELLPETFPLGSPHMDKRAFVEEADLVLCISESTRTDLLSVYGAPRAPVLVTPLGVAPGFALGVRPAKDLPDRYLLFVGNRSGYKDFSVLARAFAAARLPDEVTLVAVGGGPLDDDERELLAGLHLTSRVRQVDLSDSDMPGAYADALGFVYPSRYEGFGLPTVEAMSVGCPTILARSSSHPEVGGDAALYFEPGDVDGLVAHLEVVTGDDDVREDLAVRGRARAAGFTWANTARVTAEAYRAAVRG